jgi:transposase
MSVARLVVTAVRVEGRSLSAVAREYGVSRRWIYELLRRYDRDGDVGLEPRSRRPHSSPRQTGRDLEDEIVALRKDLVDLGVDAGGATIFTHLERRHGTSPSISTIWRTLVRRGFVTPQLSRFSFLAQIRGRSGLVLRGSAGSARGVAASRSLRVVGSG